MTEELHLSDADWQAITTHVFDVADEAQTVRVEALLAGPLGASVLREIVTLRDLGGASPHQLDHQAAWQYIASQVTDSPTQTIGTQSKKRWRWDLPLHWVLVGATAACVAIVAIGIGVHTLNLSEVDAAVGNRAAYSVATRSAQRTELTLSDGTQVFLNVTSRIEVPKEYGVRQRRITLHGQAVFRVAHASNIPFSVHAAGTEIKVLGTEFGVRAYDAQQPVSIAVRSGRVGVGTAVLQSGDIANAQYNPSRRDVTLHVFHQQDITSAFDFTTGQLNLNGARLQDVIPDLNRWYDVDIRLGSASLANRRMEGSLTSGGVESLVEVFQEVFHLRVEQQGRVVTLYETR